MSEYSEKLRDPRWQKMRLEILTRDEWCCQICFDSKSTLHVHHRYYEAGREPWDYPPVAYVTLCESCHTQEGEGRKEVEARFLRAMRSAGALNSQLTELANLFELSDMNEYEWAILICFLWKLETDRLSGAGSWATISDYAKSEWKRLAEKKEEP